MTHMPLKASIKKVASCSEADFSKVVSQALGAKLEYWKDNHDSNHLAGLVIKESVRPPIGKMAWWTDMSTSEKSKSKPLWRWQGFKRELDIVIGVEAEFDDGEKTIVPFIAIELKSSDRINTDELDKKSAIYSSLKDSYPWVKTIFLHRNLEKRSMGYEVFLRNARGFNYAFYEWDEETFNMIWKAIEVQLEYTVDYWCLAGDET